ncbi:MAG: DUF86 domain-containing protein [Roseateles asaccharophilus]|uniref:HepT-like ribonuclease domain-containing protein n=1 Tax=Roseateles asaccharophilus TaxID=582607 RepID=UPI00391B376C
MAPDSAKFLWDALQAAERAGRFVQGKTFADYLQDELLRSAVERQVEVVGEALGQLRKVDPTTAATIADLPQAVGLRNVLVHAYATVNDKLVWGVVEQHLAPLCERLKALLDTAS